MAIRKWCILARLIFFSLILITPRLHAQTRPKAQTFPLGGLFEDDFEIGGMDNWNSSPGYSSSPSSYIGTETCSGSGGTKGVVTAWANSGKYSYENVLSSSTNANCTLVANLESNTTTPNFMFTFEFVSGLSISGGNARIANVGGSTSGGETVYLTVSGGHIYTDTPCDGQGSHILAAGTAYTIEQELNTSSDTESLYVNGSLDSSGTGCSFGGGFVGNQQVSVGTYIFGGATVSGTIYWDDVRVASSPITYSSHTITVRHPSSFGRTAIPLLLVMSGGQSGDTITVSMDGTQEASYNWTGNSMQVQFPCCMSYSVGNHTMLVAENTGSTTNASWTETIPAYNSSFPVEIDGYNNLSENGIGIFPILPFVGDYGSCSGSNQFQYEFWTSACSTGPYATAAGWSDGINQPNSSSAWKTAIDGMYTDTGVLSLGPNQPSATWTAETGYFSDGTTNTTPTVENSYIASFASSLASDTHMLGYSWIDEPTFWGLNSATTPIIWSWVANWTTLTHENDANHIVWLNLQGSQGTNNLYQGYFNLPYGNAPVSSEVLAMDLYPVQSNGTYTIAQWVSYLDLFERENYYLVPFNFDLEGSCAGGGCSANATGNQLREEAWLATIHGAKAITWFVAADGSSGSTTDQLSGIEAFYTLSQTSSIAQALTSPATSLTVTSNQTVAGTRVDAMVKQDGNEVTVFGQRLTDIGETDSALSTTFTISGCSFSGTATVIGESRTVPVSNCQITDSFNAYDTHVYEFNPSGSIAPPGQLTATPH